MRRHSRVGKRSMQYWENRRILWKTPTRVSNTTRRFVMEIHWQTAYLQYFFGILKSNITCNVVYLCTYVNLWFTVIFQIYSFKVTRAIRKIPKLVFSSIYDAITHNRSMYQTDYKLLNKCKHFETVFWLSFFPIISPKYRQKLFFAT